MNGKPVSLFVVIAALLWSCAVDRHVFEWTGLAARDDHGRVAQVSYRPNPEGTSCARTMNLLGAEPTK